MAYANIYDVNIGHVMACHLWERYCDVSYRKLD